MKTTIRQLIWLLALLLIATAAQEQTDLAVNQAFQKYGSQKGCKMVTLIDGQLKGYDLKVYKSLSFRKYGKEIMALVKADRPKAKKIREIVEDGQPRNGYYMMPPQREGINRYVLFRCDEDFVGAIVYIEGHLLPDDIMKITKR